MKLQDWMDQEKLSVGKAAKEFGIFPASLRQFLTGKCFLHPKNEEEIVKQTRGKVGYADLRPYIRGGKNGKAA